MIIISSRGPLKCIKEISLKLNKGPPQNHRLRTLTVFNSSVEEELASFLPFTPTSHTHSAVKTSTFSVLFGCCQKFDLVV